MELVKPVFDAVAKDFDYKIISSEQKDDNTVKFKAEITMCDLSPFLKDYMSKIMSYGMSNFSAMLTGELSEEEQAEQVKGIITECIANADLSNLVTKEIDITVVKGDDKKWRTQVDESFMTALSQGLFSEAYSNFGEMFNNYMGNAMNTDAMQQSMEEALKAVTPADYGGYVQGDGLNPSDTMAAETQRQMNEMQQQMNNMGMMN